MTPLSSRSIARSAGTFAALAALSSCGFPTVELGGDGGASTTSGPPTSSGDATTTSTTSTAQASTGQGGPGSTSTSDGGGAGTSGGGDGGQSSGDGGGGRSSSGGGDGGMSGSGGSGGRPSTSGGGGGDGPGTGGDGPGTGGGTTATTSGGGGAPDNCPATGCDACEGNCPDGATSTDCDDDGSANGADCQMCDARVHPGQALYFTTSYTRLDGQQSFDYDCVAGPESDLPYDADGCDAYGSEDCPEETYIGPNPPVCGQDQGRQSCTVSSAVAGVLGMCANAGGGVSTDPVPCH
jgi:hypothetical protein